MMRWQGVLQHRLVVGGGEVWNAELFGGRAGVCGTFRYLSTLT